MNDLNKVLAFDIGTKKISCLAAIKSKEGSIIYQEFKECDSNGINKGNIINQEQFEIQVLKLMNSFKSFLDEDPVILIGNSSKDVKSSMETTEIFFSEKVKVISEDDLEKSMDLARNNNLQSDQKILHVIPLNFNLDGIHGIKHPLGMHSRKLELVTNNVTIQKNPKDKILKTFSSIELKPYAILANSVSGSYSTITKEEKDHGVIVLDIGAGTTDISVFFQGTNIFNDVIPVGGNQFTNDLSMALDIPFSEAEKIKIKFGTVTPELLGKTDEISSLNNEGITTKFTQREIGQILKERGQELLRLAKLKLDNSPIHKIPINRLVLSGGGSKLEGIQPLTKYIFQYYVRMGMPSDTSKIPDFLDKPELNSLIGIIKFFFNNNDLIETEKKKNYIDKNKFISYPNFFKTNTLEKYQQLIKIEKLGKISNPIKKYIKKKTAIFNEK